MLLNNVSRMVKTFNAEVNNGGFILGLECWTRFVTGGFYEVIN